MKFHSIFDNDTKHLVWPFVNTDPVRLNDDSGYVGFPIGDGHAECAIRLSTMSNDGLQMSSVRTHPGWGHGSEHPEYSLYIRQSPITPWTLALYGCLSDPVNP